MNAAQIESFVMQYIQSTNSQIIEKGLAYATVKLSPQADKDLTQRSYYWGFVERTGAEPETLTYCFVFDPLSNGLKPQEIVQGRGAWSAATRTQQHDVTFGSRRLEQIFQTVRSRGRWINLFEEPLSQKKGMPSTGYSTWLGINYKLELVCDMKRSEIHSFGISLGTGEIIENFQQSLLSKKLTPRLPLNVHLLSKRMTLERAATLAEHHLESKIKRYDHSWAVEARERLQVEQTRMDDYYVELLKSIVEEDHKAEVEEQYRNRQAEINWQYQPRIDALAMNCGLFHLRAEDKS